MRGGTMSRAAWALKPSEILPPDGPKEKAKAVTSSSAATARSPHGSRSGTRVRGRSAPRLPSLSAMRFWCSRHSACEKMLSLPLGRSVCTSTGLCSNWLAASMRRSISAADGSLKKRSG